MPSIVHHLSSPQDKVDPHFKHWVKSRNFQLADLPGLGLFKVLVIPNEGNNKEDGVKLLRVVHANQLCVIVQAVNADELKHSGYKKLLDYQYKEYLQKQDDILSQENKAKARARYKADPEKKKASVRDSYKADPEKKKASVRDPAVRLAKRAAERNGIAGVTELPP
ncbi:hypothetical protein EMCRGX_G010983 [Ephydatia muelleri]